MKNISEWQDAASLAEQNSELVDSIYDSLDDLINKFDVNEGDIPDEIWEELGEIASSIETDNESLVKASNKLDQLIAKQKEKGGEKE